MADTPAIITVAITGSVPKKKDTPAVPVTPAQQIESTHEAYEAGASLAVSGNQIAGLALVAGVPLRLSVKPKHFSRSALRASTL